MRAGQAVTAALAVGFGVTLLGLVATGELDARDALASAGTAARSAPTSGTSATRSAPASADTVARSAPASAEPAERPAPSMHPMVPATLAAMVPAALAAIDPAALAAAAAASSASPAAPVSSGPAASLPGRPAAAREGLDLSSVLRTGDHYEAPFGASHARLTLVPRVQEKLRAILDRHAPPYAAAVVLDVATGRVLGFAGVSSDDPAAGALLPLQPFGPAASVFKLVTAAALLDADPSAAKAPVCYTGGKRRITARDLLDDPRRDHKCAALDEAVSHSLNVPIGKMALHRLDPASLVRAAERFGFNRPTPFDVPVAASTTRLPKTSLELARTAAGFEGVRLSALHGAVLASAIAAGGVVRRPGIIERVEGTSGALAGSGHAFAAETVGRAMAPAEARTLGRMMVATTTEGTARREFAHDRSLRDRGVAGKTGSLYDRETNLDFSWFVGFAPAEAPRVAVAVFVANRALWHIRATYVGREALAAVLRTP